MSYKRLSRNTFIINTVMVLGSILYVPVFMLRPTSVFAQFVTVTTSVGSTQHITVNGVAVNGTPSPTSQPARTVVTVVVTATPTITPTIPVYRDYKPRIALPTLTLNPTPT